MNDRKALGLLVLIMALSAIVVGVLAIAALYQAELNRYRRDLVDAARAHAAAIAARGERASRSANPVSGLPLVQRQLHEAGRLLQEKGKGDEEDRQLIADALWSAERGAELIHRLLAFAGRQRLHRCSCPRPRQPNLPAGKPQARPNRGRSQWDEGRCPGARHKALDRGAVPGHVSA